MGLKGWLLPKRFFVVGGKGVSNVSQLNAFDESLKAAGIANCNLINVSSILPEGAVEVPPQEIPPGALTFAVISKMDGRKGDRISAGIAWAWEKGKRYGIVAEAHSNVGPLHLKEELTRQINQMAKSRGIEIEGINYKIESLEDFEAPYGCVVVALVYIL